MALSHIIKHIYNNGAEEVIRKGKKINQLGFVELVEHDELTSSVVFRVKDDHYSTFYKVYISKYIDPRMMSLRCSCPYNQGDICKHEVAALFRLQDLVDKNLLSNSAIQYNQHHTVAKIRFIDLKMIRMLSSQSIYEKAERMLRTHKANILSAADERVEAEINIDGQCFPLVIQKNDERNFDTSCSCSERLHPLCEHKVMLFLQLLDSYGPHYFDSIRNWDKEKNKLLQIYGYSLSDDLDGKFEFTYKEGKPYLKVLDPSIKRVSSGSISAFNRREPEPELPAEVDTIDSPNRKLGVVFNFNHTAFPGFRIDVIQGEMNDSDTDFVGMVETLDLGKFVNTESFSDEDRQLVQLVRKMQESEINKYLNRNSPFSGIWENIIHNGNDELPEETKALIAEYLHPKLRKLFEEKEKARVAYILPKGKPFRTVNLEQVTPDTRFLEPQFRVTVDDNKYYLECVVKINGHPYRLNENEVDSPMLMLHNHTVYLWKQSEDVIHAEKVLQQDTPCFSASEWVDQLKNNILPLAKAYHVEFDRTLVKELKSTVPDVKVQLLEKGDYLVFQPIFSYHGFDVKAGSGKSIMMPEADKVLLIRRNESFEEEIINKLDSLHSQFIRQDNNGCLILKGIDVLRNNWFFLFIDAMKEMKISVFGFEALRNFRFNTSRPNTHIHVSSGQDWFDANVEIEFGEQRVGIADIKRALSGKQSFVQLGDGTLGILPDEWLKRYSLLFKVGEGKNNRLRLSKYHMSVIDELYENRDMTELSFALDEKFQRLREFKNIPETKVPSTLTGTLRPYQVSGFQWLHYLNDVGWGGILADDMGLGKTVQALAMLDHYKNTQGILRAIVICPTTLIYNWENEVKKFTPRLSYVIHHGNARARDPLLFEGTDIVITTYGTLRSDVRMLMKINFDYIILDESQAIKNPSSKVTKAASLLQAKNRLCMSGTPLQNNTFDIFAQMNFLNPGLLGSVEFFRNEFATPIDKFGEPEQKEHLRKLLYPFILRRTKEQVARDLPEKTETILFCEMEKEQRKIYDAFRNSYRDKILGTIDEKGIEKSQLTILQGLMKLRQICDSPAILNEDEKYPNESIKLEELAREIKENTGEHKTLIFSQFLGMLSLIKGKLKELEIPFEYFDGSTSAHERDRAIRNFQENNDCRVFLISLKAGGVGLNLTAADYVYIVDPWWNPAVEQQAIDRTHRIGQTKNIFAYRMICIDTIEDKILQLQEKKKTLAKELITDDSGFVKSLTKADVEYLFS